MPADHDRDPVTVEERGVVVEKSFDTDSFPLPTVVLTLTNRVGSPARVSLVDAVPEDVPMSDVGFHPDYGADHWEAHRNGEVAFERDFDAGESVTTVYAVRAADAGDGERFATPPSVTVERSADARTAPEREPADAGLDDVDAAARAFVEDVDRE